MANSDYPYHVIDPTTPWAAWLEYCEICHQLEVKDQPNMRRYMGFRNYLKSVGIL